MLELVLVLDLKRGVDFVVDEDEVEVDSMRRSAFCYRFDVRFLI